MAPPVGGRKRTHVGTGIMIFLVNKTTDTIKCGHPSQAEIELGWCGGVGGVGGMVWWCGEVVVYWCGDVVVGWRRYVVWWWCSGCGVVVMVWWWCDDVVM